MIDPIGLEFDSASFTDRSVTIKATKAPRDRVRPPVQISMGCDVEGVAPPHANIDPLTMEAGIHKRFCKPPPQPVQAKFARLKEFVQKECKRRWTPLSPDTDVSFETWLSKTNYPLKRKQDLEKKWNDCGRKLSSRHHKVKSFIKDETYMEYKHARAINSRSDPFKCAFGPFIKAIEEQIYKDEAFIKKVPVADRPQYILDRLVAEGNKYFYADFVAFESHFLAEILKAIEFQVYKYMTQHISGHHEFMRMCNEVIAGPNHCVFKYLTVDVVGRRMSGEMNTSLGNGIANLLLLRFLFSELGENPTIIVEGDDSNSSYQQRCPTAQDFADVGFTVKCGTCSSPSEMSFCGLIFDPEECINITDPLKVLANFGWARMEYTTWSPKKLRMLLRMKSLSLAHQYPGCPVIQELAEYGLRVTSRVDVRHFAMEHRSIGWWEREQFKLNVLDAKGKIKNSPHKEVSMKSRHLMEKEFNIPISTQINVENYLRSLTSIQVLSGPIVDLPFGSDLRTYAESYVFDVHHIDEIAMPLYKRPNFNPEFRPAGVSGTHYAPPV